MARPVKSSDLLGLKFVSDPQLAPGARRAAVVVTEIVGPQGEALSGRAPKAPKRSERSKESKKGAPRYRSRILLHDLTGGGRRRPLPLTQGEYSDDAPRFSPGGGELAFRSVREENGKPQLYVIGLEGGEARRLTEHGAGIGDFAWHPDGERIAYLSRGDWEDEAGRDGTPRRIARRRWRADGAGFLPTEPAHLYLLDVASGKSRKLADLTEAAGELTFSPDGRTLFLVAESPESEGSDFRGDLLSVEVESGKVRPLLEGVLALRQPSPSADGRSVAYQAAADQADFVSAAGLWLLDVKRTRGGLSASGEPRLLSGDLETQHSAGGDSRYGAYPGKAAWLSDDSLMVIVNREGATNLVTIGLDGEVSELQTREERVVSAFSALPGAAREGEPVQPTVAFLAESPTEPGELWLLEGGGERRVSNVNGAWRRKLDLQQPAGPFAAGDADVPYWTLEPAEARSDRAAVVQVHGGPHTNYGYGFNFEFQLLAARGYAVIYGNPRGSSSYGFTFATAMLGDYGSVDADDVMAIAEAGAAQLGRAKAPLHLTGGSYGGFMTNWLIGRSKRFTSAVTQRSISNWTSMYGTSDIGPYFVERQLGGVPWGDVGALWHQSPIRFAAEITTPLLVIHSEEDHRTPVEQGEQLYAAIKRLGRAETEFFRVPGEGHELSRSGRPDRRVARLDAIIDWFERHPR